MEPKKPIGSRVAGWVGRKFNGTAVGQVNAILVDNARLSLSRARPRPLDQVDIEQGLSGRYEDGGRRRFREAAAQQGWDETDLQQRERQWRQQARVFLVAGLGLIAIPVAWCLLQPGLFALAMLVPGLTVPAALLAVSIKADFAAWQIRERRFGGLRDYFQTRTGSK